MEHTESHTNELWVVSMYGGSKLKAKKSHFFPGNTSLVYVHDLSSIAIDQFHFWSPLS